jgi:hypothetical protein
MVSIVDFWKRLRANDLARREDSFSMIDRSPSAAATAHRAAQSLTRLGQLISRYGLVVVLAWIGFGKFVKMESRVLIEHSPLMSWIYDVASVTTVARGPSTMEIVAALLITLEP